MSKILTRSGKGSALTHGEMDDNFDYLAGKNVVVAGASYTVDIDDQNNILEFTNSGTVTVTLDLIATIAAAAHSSDYKVTLLATGTGAVVVNTNAADTFLDGSTSLTLDKDEPITIQTSNTATSWIVKDNGYIPDTGTWTPVLTDGTNNGTMNVQFGTYRRLPGNMAYVYGDCGISDKGSLSGDLKISGFTSILTPKSSGNFIIPGYQNGVDGMDHTAVVSVQFVTSEVLLRRITASTIGNNATSALDAAEISTNFRITFNGMIQLA